MEIVDNRKCKKEYTFESLLFSTIFSLNSGELCLKISDSEAFSFDTVTTFAVPNDLKVTPIKAHLVLED